MLQTWRFLDLQNGSHMPSWICWMHIGTTHKEYLEVFVVVLVLIGISAVVLTVQISVFCASGLKMPIYAPQIIFWEILHWPLSRKIAVQPPKAHPCAKTFHMTYRSPKFFEPWGSKFAISITLFFLQSLNTIKTVILFIVVLWWMSELHEYMRCC